MFGSTLQNGTNASGSNTNSWGSSTGFGNNSALDNSANAPRSGSLNANSSPNTGNAGGLFGNLTTTPTGGLFGNLNTSNTGGSGILNGNKPSSFGGLFGNSSTNNATNNTFGASQSNSTNKNNSLFGNALDNKPGTMNLGNNNQNNLFANSTVSTQPSNVSTINTNGNPYNFNSVFNDLQNADSLMPKSVTEDMFAPNNNKESSGRKRMFSQVEKPRQENSSKSSLLSRLGQSLKFFRYSDSSKSSNNQNFASIKGLFTQSNFLTSNDRNGILPKSASLAPKRISKRSYGSSIDSRGIKRLVIKSKPLKFHLIDADKVFNTKRRRIVSGVTLSDKLLSDNILSDDEDSDDEIIAGQKPRESFVRFPYKVSTEDKTRDGKSAKAVDNFENKSPMNDNIEDANGYWCTPSLKELSELSAQSLTNVENFIVGRIGRGQIAYSYPVDLSGVAVLSKENNTSLREELFGNIVEIGNRIVKVYQHAENKPPIGFGLNIPATISLEGIKPREGESRSDFIRYLQRQVGMEFVTYDPITCVWTFRVKHFSIWGLVDDENIEKGENKLAEMKRKQDSKEQEAMLEYSRIYENDKYNQELKKQKISNYTIGLPGGWEYNQTTHSSPINTKRNLVADEINKQMDLYKQEQTANALTANVSDITIDSDSSSTSGSPNGIELDLPEAQAPFENKNFDYLKQFISVLPKNINMDDIINEKAYEPEISNDAIFDNIQLKPNLAISDDWLVQLELCNDINSSLTPYLSDVSKKIKEKQGNLVTVDKVDDILFSEFNKDSLSANYASTPIKPKNTSNLELESFENYDESHPKHISKIIYHMLSKSNISHRSNMFPFVEKNKDLAFADLMINDKTNEEEDHILQLGSALFDEHKITDYTEFKNVDQSDKRLINHLENLQQRKIFGQWLRKYNKPVIDKLSTELDTIERIFMMVCGGELKDAISLALESNNAHLSVLLTLIDSNDEAVKTTALNQLQYWKDTSAVNLIPEPIVKIYKLLAGDFTDALVGLPWNVVLAARLYYGDNTIQLHELFHDFQDGVKDEGPVYDILTLFNQLHSKSAEEALGNIKESHLNIKLKWFFNKILTKVDMDGTNDELSLNFGRFLESIGLWKEALFVYSHITGDEENERIIRNLVISNISQIKSSTDEEDFITKVLCVPQSLIYEAVGIQEHTLGNYWQECEALVTAKLWEKAHYCIVKELGPTSVISNESTSKNRLLELISQFPESGRIIPQWDQGAGVYENYIKLIDQTDEPTSDMVTLIHFLLSNLPLLRIKTFKCGIAAKLMSKRTGDFALDSSSHIDNINSKIMALPLGEPERNYFTIRLKLVNVK